MLPVITHTSPRFVFHSFFSHYCSGFFTHDPSSIDCEGFTLTIKSCFYILTSAIFTLHFFIFTPTLTAQTGAQLKEQAEARLKQMSPEEIEQKLKEFGITREEAIRRARELNISLEEYLARPAGGTVSTPAETAPEPSLQPVQPLPSRPEPAAAPMEMHVPGISHRSGAENLEPFGYRIFRLPAATFEPVLNLSSPPSYALGPGDEVVITVWGETRLNYQLQINREGNVILPDVGPVSANGATLDEFKQRLLRRMSGIYSGLDSRYGKPNTFLDVSLGKLRTIQVFVLGEVVRPGGYAVSSFSTVFGALYLAGGATVHGTMRDVRVMRTGGELAPIDLYDYIIRGDKTKDIRLNDGDVVFVKPAGPRAAVAGSVVRPAIYELKQGETLGDLLALAGGLRFDAYFNRMHIERVVPFEERSNFEKNILDIDISFSSVGDLQRSTFPLEAGDILSVFRITDFLQNRVSISGNVNKPGRFELRNGMRIKDLIVAADSLQPSTFSERGTLFRVLPNRRKEIHAFSPRRALEGDPGHNLVLQNEDSVVLYTESQFFPEQTVSIAGAVRSPGTFPRSERMTLADLVVLAGGLTEGASMRGWEVSRMDTTELGKYSTVYTLDVTSDYWNAKNQQAFVLSDLDFVFVPADPRYTTSRLVTLTGSVMSPGQYAIRYEGERLSALIARAGGLRPGAYLEGSRFYRRLNNTGMIPLDFQKSLNDTTSRDNVVLKENDSIHVASHEDVVYVTGEVFVPSAILYKKGEGVDYYIAQAGGFKEEADESRVVAFLPGGKKWEPGWFFFGDPELPPGSSINVPREIEKEDKTLPTLGNIATILASLAAITVAIVQISK